MKKALIIALAVMMVTSSLFAQGAAEPGKAAAAGPAKVSYWAPMNAAITANDFGELPVWQEVEKATNTEIEFEHAPAASKALSEAFNILVASGDYPDIIEYKWIAYPGGPQVAIDDGIIIPLNDVIEKYAPNLNKLLKENPEIAKMVSTPDGTYYCFPALRGTSYENNNLLFSEGWLWRTDLLKKAGINEVPETPEEVYAAAVALKGIGVEIPLCIRHDHIGRVFGPGFDSWDDFYVEDGKVKHGLIEPQRREYLEFLRKCYAEGLLDNDYLNLTKKSLGVKVLNNQIGGAYAPGGSGIGTWLPQMQKDDPSVEMHSARPISPSRDRLSKFAKMSTIYSDSMPSAAITTSCKNVEAAARLLDYMYSPEGHMLMNFGIEGKTYTMENGYPKYTDFIKNNPDGLSMSQVMAQYMRCSTNGAFVQDPRYLEQYYGLPELTEAIGLWAQTDYGKYVMPPVSQSSEEGQELAQILNRITTFYTEQENKFITGADPLNDETFKAYQDQLKKFGIERAIEIKQKAYEAYMAK